MEEQAVLEQAQVNPVDVIDFDPPPTEDELPYDDGMPMESDRHVQQMILLKDSLHLYLAQKRDDFFIGSNMFVYFSPHQVRTHDFRGPDLFVALGVAKRERKSWVVWQEEKGPAVVIELLSGSTATQDKVKKKLIYQERLRVPEYFWFDPFSGELAGFALRDGVYEPIELDDKGRLISKQLDLALVCRESSYIGLEAPYLRWATLDGAIVPTREELAQQERQRADQATQRAESERERAESERERAETERQAKEEVQARMLRLAAKLKEMGLDPDAL